MTNQDKTRWKQIRNKGEKWRNTGEKKRCKLNQRIEALTPMSFLFTPVGRLVDWPVWGAVFSPFRGSHAQWRPFWRPMVSLTGQLGLLLSSKRGCGRGKRKRLLLKKCNGWWLDKRLIDWLIDWNKGMADWMNGILKETKTKCSSKLCEEEVNYKCVDISIYISLLWIDSSRLKKKNTIVSVRLPSVFVDDGLDAFAVILPQNCWATVDVVPRIDDGDVEIAGSARALFFWALLQMVFVPILQHAL